ncbi:MAG: aminopeptidase [Muribaculaceae bacterium]|nr:aminopeptidase [Muribaculaceae bacterium]
MKKLLTLAAIAAICAPAAFADEPAEEKNDSTGGFTFTDVKVVKTTPVKDQNKSGTCWCFATTSFLEDELLRKTGKEYDLSEMFSVYHCYLDKAQKYQRMGGTINFAQGGSALDVPYVWENYGAVPESVYSGLNYGEEKHDHYEMADLLTSYMEAVTKPGRKKLSPAWKGGFEGILKSYFGELPETFTYEGKTYTPKSFAESLPLNMDDYISVTSWTHHPFYTWFPVEVADNWLWADSWNVPMEEMKAIVDNALEKGYPVVWSADVSEPGFKWVKGYAILPEAKTEKDMTNTELSRWVKLSDKEREAEKYSTENGPVKEQTVTQESRQQGLDNLETTDDHGMVLVGIATDQNGNRYYKVKNSWDTNQIYDGFFYVSEPYFLAKTMGIYVNKEALPKESAKKLK